MRFRIFSIRFLLCVVGVCAIIFAFYPWIPRPTITAFEHIRKHPVEVQVVIAGLKRIPGDCSLEDFETRLQKIEHVSTRHYFFKDFEYYWKIETDSVNGPTYILAGTFMPGKPYRLSYVTLNIIETSGGPWRTIWLADYPSDRPKAIPPIVRE